MAIDARDVIVFKSIRFRVSTLIRYVCVFICIPFQQRFQIDAFSLDPVYTVPDPHGHDIKLNSFKTSVALKSMIILHNLITTNHKKSGRSNDGLKLTELDVVTMRIRYRVNGVLVWTEGRNASKCIQTKTH